MVVYSKGKANDSDNYEQTHNLPQNYRNINSSKLDIFTCILKDPQNQ